MLYYTDKIDSDRIDSGYIVSALYRSDSDISATDMTNRIVLESETELNVTSPVKLFFFCFSAGYREKLSYRVGKDVLLSDPDSLGFIYEIQKKKLNDLNEQTKNISPNCSFAINMSFGDFCLVVPENEEPELARLYALDEIKPYSKSENSVWDTAHASELRGMVLNKLDSRHISRYVPHNKYRSEVFENLLNSDVDTLDKAEECARIASVLIHYFTDEVAAHCLYYNGDSKKTSIDLQNHLDYSYNTLNKNLNRFVEQASVKSILSDTVWSFSFLSEALLSVAFGRSFDDGVCASLDEYNDFHGFIPYLTRETQTVESLFPDQFGPTYSFAFLAVPYALTMDLYGRLPALLHEFSHYIPTPNREKRNKTVLKLTIKTVMNKPIQKILKLSGGKEIAERIIKSILDRYCFLYDMTLTFPFKEDENGFSLRDSMFFLHQTFDLFEAVGFDDLYNCAYKVSGLTGEIIGILKECKEECSDVWSTNAQSFLITYTMALREIRSDIAMYKFLSPVIDLEKYVLLMASEPTWASQSEYSTADSVFLRFGFMTRYLYARESSDGRSDGFNMDWYRRMIKIFDGISSAHPELKERINHMREYINEYIEISFVKSEKKNKKYISIEDSVFENMIAPGMFSGSASEDDADLVKPWEKQFDIINNRTSFFEKLAMLYGKYENEKGGQSRIIMNHKARLVFRDLFLYYPDIDIE